MRFILGVWKVCGGYTEGMWRVCKRCMENAWRCVKGVQGERFDVN